MTQNNEPKQNNMAVAVAAMADEINQLQNAVQSQYQTILQLTAENANLKAELVASCSGPAS